MSNKIGSKTPAQTHNDLFYLNNGNSGIDQTLRVLYSGNGEQTKIKISQEKAEIDFNTGDCKKPNIQQYTVSATDKGLVPSSYQIKLLDGNIQKINIDNDTTFSIAATIPANSGTDFTLLILKLAADKKINFSGNVKVPSGGFIQMSNSINTVDVIKLVTVDAGANWYAYRIGQDLQ